MGTADKRLRNAATEQNHVYVPDDIRSATAKLVYLYVHSVGRTTISELRTALNIKLLTVFGVISILSSQGHISRDGESLIAQNTY